jgi:hypothetical protein
MIRGDLKLTCPADTAARGGVSSPIKFTPHSETVRGVRFVSGRCGSARNTPDVEAHAGGMLEQMLDDGELSHHPEDVAIQRNTRHAWRNPSTTARAIEWIVVGALASPDLSSQSSPR